MKKSLLILLLLGAGGAGAQTEWKVMNSSITTFAQKPGNTNEVFAGDAGGLIRRSFDQGATWKLSSMASEFQISSIGFINANVGFAGTIQPGLVLVTNDGGNTWNRKMFTDTNPSFPNPYSATTLVTVANNNTVYLNLSMYAAQKAIVSRDGGATFKASNVPGTVFHANGDTLVAFGPLPDFFGINRFTIYKSTDNGVMWDTVITSPAGLNSTDFGIYGFELAHFLSANVFFITCGRGGSQTIYKTTDGGLNFTALTRPGTQTGKPKYMHFKNQDEGFAIMNYSADNAYYTSDGGTTWTATQKVFTPALYLGSDKLISCRTDRTTLSTDYARNWTDQSDQISSVSSSGGPGLHHMSLVNDSVSYAYIGKLSSGVYEGRQLVKTTNGGISWRKVNVRDSSGTLSLIASSYLFLSEDTFFFDQGNFIYRTTNGGLTSRKVYSYPNFNVHNIRNFTMLDNRHIVAYGYGETFFSTDRGNTWTMTSGGLSDITALATPAMNNWFATTTAKKVYHSTDSGQTWIDISSSFTGASCASGLYFLNSTTGFVYGCTKGPFKTTDGGQTWVNMETGVDTKVTYNNNYLMVFRTDSIGYMADPYANGYVISYTQDRGNTWTSHPGAINNGSRAICFKDANTGAAFGTFGSYIKYTGPLTFNNDTIRPVITNTIDTVPPVTGLYNTTLQHVRVMLYPNPATDVLHVETGDNYTIQSLHIYDLNGRIVEEMTVSGSTKQEVNTRQFKPGIYFIQVTTPAGTAYQKFCVTR